jgi:hypothetical protein
MVVEGLQDSHASDDELLREGMALFEALYRSIDQSPKDKPPRNRRRRR